MNRSTNILGFAFLAVAATLALSITMRNSPEPPKTGSGPAAQGANSRSTGGTSVAPERSTTLRHRDAARKPTYDPLKVSVSQDWLATLSPAERQDWFNRASEVEREASEQLERLTASLDLNSTQRRKLFPALVRATSGYDPAMIVGGALVADDPSLTPAEQIHSLLEPDQQAQLEDDEVQRQLWWQDVIDKLEADLTNATGGPAASSPEAPTPVDEERIAPEGREGGNLFDRISPR